MKDYLDLQYKMANRHLRDFGVHPVLGYCLVAVVFLLASEMLFTKVIYAQYLYVAFSLSTLSNLNGAARNNFLKTCFSLSKYRKIRIIENLAVATPFVFFIIYKQAYILAPIIILGSILMTFFQTTISFNRHIPTPFGGRPFEFPRGFRIAWPAFLLSYFLCYMSIQVDNFNLGLFSLALSFIICLTFYGEVEGEFFVWLHKMKPKEFLIHKAITAVLYSMLLALPVAISLVVAFSSLSRVILIVVLLGLLNVIGMVFVRYTSYPKNVILPQAILFVIALIFSPLLFISLPYFYNRSVRSLYKTLG